MNKFTFINQETNESRSIMAESIMEAQSRILETGFQYNKIQLNDALFPERALLVKKEGNVKLLESFNVVGDKRFLVQEDGKLLDPRISGYHTWHYASLLFDMMVERQEEEKEDIIKKERDKKIKGLKDLEGLLQITHEKAINALGFREEEHSITGRIYDLINEVQDLIDEQEAYQEVE